MWTECPHPDSEIRRKVNAVNVPMCARQCVTCGANLSSWLPKKDWPANPPPWDDAVSERWWARRRAEVQAAADELVALNRAQLVESDGARAAERAAWWARYDAHINSPKWRMIANKVRARERGYCQGCGERDEYGHCHHADYSRMGDEMLFDLRWLCRPCHQKMHPHRELGGSDAR